MPRLGQEEDCSGEGSAAVLLFRTQRQLKAAQYASVYVPDDEFSREETEDDSEDESEDECPPTCQRRWDDSGDSEDETPLDSEAENEPEKNTSLGPLFPYRWASEAAASWGCGVVQPPPGQWTAVEGCLDGYQPGVR